MDDPILHIAYRTSQSILIIQTLRSLSVSKAMKIFVDMTEVEIHICWDAAC